jgi:hypothetical protein
MGYSVSYNKIITTHAPAALNLKIESKEAVPKTEVLEQPQLQKNRIPVFATQIITIVS